MGTQFTSETNHVDVLILGGGPAGITAGLALLKRGDTQVCVVERGDYSEDKYGESMSSTVRSTLEYLDVWNEFVNTQSQTPFLSNVTWGSEDQKEMGQMFSAQNSSWTLDRSGFEKMMAKAFSSRGGKLITNSQVVTCEHQAEGNWRVVVKSDDHDTFTVICKFIIDASGRRGVMRTNLNLALTVHDRLIGVGCIGTVPESEYAQFTNQVEACEYGWWHLTLMDDCRISVVLMTDPDIANGMQVCQAQVWRSLLESMPHMGLSMQNVFFADKPRSFPCYSSYLSQAGGKGWVAIGDAVASFDPIASSGIPRALATGIHGAFIAVDNLYSDGKLLETYSQAVEQNFKQYLQMQWQAYQRETRWPKALFWARRRAVIAISKDAFVASTNFYEQKLGKSSTHLKNKEMQELLALCIPGKALKEVLQDFSRKHIYLPEQRIMLGLQELIERSYLEIAAEEDEDCVFFNTARMHFD